MKLAVNPNLFSGVEIKVGSTSNLANHSLMELA